MTTSITREGIAPSTSRRRTRGLAVAAAVLADVGVWAVAVPLLDVDLAVSSGGTSPQTIGVGAVAGASLVACLLGWGLLALLDGRTPSASTIWTAIALGVLVISLAGPLTGVTAGAKATLVIMHLAAAGVLIPQLRRSTPTP